MTIRYCPRCGARVLRRLGVLLTPRLADVFDAIQRATRRGGIRSDVLEAMFGKAAKVHVYHLNVLLTPSASEIYCDREGNARGFYRVRKKRFAKQIKPINDSFANQKTNLGVYDARVKG